jgi:6-methylsalicylic acid synthase
LQKKHASGEIPLNRWEPWRQRSALDAKIVSSITRKGYFLDDVEGFDAAFFGISPREAEHMDPHQRLGLELAYEALQNAGIQPDRLAGSDTAVYIGVDSDDYSRMVMEDLPAIEAWSGIGTAHHGVSNRISYHFDLKGPSAAVDAACASSLVALHLARQAIVSGESTVAICGGVNVICAPGITHMLQKAGALTEKGVCRSFDAAADGYARGEGGAIIILKRLSAAQEDNDNILAVLKSSASAQDGKTRNIMAPNGAAQVDVARQALCRAGNIDPHTVNYVEAHATATRLGDPTEIKAMAEVYGEGRSREKPCYLGSIKPNVGHLEAAAGAISVVKTVLSVQKGVIAPQALLETLNTHIDWESSGLEVAREAKLWPGDGVRRAAVCSYGYGGSVCHAIIEQAPPKRVRKSACHDKATVLLALSARQRERLLVYATSLAHWLSTHGKSEDMTAVARTLAQRRTAYDYRLCVDVSSRECAIQSLRSYMAHKPDARTTSGRVIRSAAVKGVVWVFSGHGAQWPNMGKQLLLNPVFRNKLSELDSIFQREAEFSSIQALQQGELGGSDRVQMLTYAVQIGLASLLQAEGITPQAVIGHSVGEISAAVIAGCLTSEEGAVVVSRRANLYAQVQGCGAMALVTLSYEEARAELRGGDDIVAAIRSSPSTCVVSGTGEAVHEYVQQLKARGIKTWKVQTDIAFHSPLLRHLVPALQHGLKHATHARPGNLRIYSTSDPDPKTEALRDVSYWIRNTVDPVRLTDAVDAAVEDGFQVFLEVSTHAIVSQFIEETLRVQPLSEYASFGVMSRNESCNVTIPQAISRLWSLGAHVDFRAQLADGPWSTRVPNMRWDRRQYWKIASSDLRPSVQQHDVEKHSLVGGLVEVAGSDTSVWTTTLDDSTKPYPLTHKLGATELVPAAVYCNTLHHATGAHRITDLQLRVPIRITAEKRELQVVSEGSAVRISSRVQASNEEPSDGRQKHAWVEHCTAKVASSDTAAYQHEHSITAIQKRMATHLPSNFAKDHLNSMGVSSMAFPWSVLEHRQDKNEMLVQVDVQGNAGKRSLSTGSWAPLIDAATSISSCILSKSTTMRIVSGIEEVVFVSKDTLTDTAYLFIERRPGEEPQRVDVDILDDIGTRLCRLEGLQFTDIEAVSHASPCIDSLLYRLAWVRPALRETPLCTENAILISARGLHLNDYIQDLEREMGNVLHIQSARALAERSATDILMQSNTLVFYVPATVEGDGDVSETAHTVVCEVAEILSSLVRVQSTAKLFVLLHSVHRAQRLGQVSYHSLYGFSRVAASEHPGIWGGLIDHEGSAFPFLGLRCERDQSVIRVQDDGLRVARLRPLPAPAASAGPRSTLLPHASGTYVVTGGLGDLGLKVLKFLVEEGARRIVVVSRGSLPPQAEWSAILELMKNKGGAIHTLQLDISSKGASVVLTSALERLSLPPVRGVVHAAAVPEFGLIKNTTPQSYARVMAPKIAGALALHEAFPPGTLDFLIFFSSVSGIVGTPGHCAYAASNTFLDGLARYRRSQGCNSTAILWTAWRQLGLASNTDVVNSELQAAGMGDITAADALKAWKRLSGTNIDHAVVTRLLPLDPREPVPLGLIHEVAPRRVLATKPSARSASATDGLTGSALKANVAVVIRQCLLDVLGNGGQCIDDNDRLSDIGVDSSMSTRLRQMLQKLPFRIQEPFTWLWEDPTIEELIAKLSGT